MALNYYSRLIMFKACRIVNLMDYYNFFIVGIGGSAGGLEPLIELVRDIPQDPNAAFVVVHHLHPKTRSRLDEILSKHSSLPIIRVEQPELVRPGVIYLLVENKMMTLKQGFLIPRERRPEEKINHAIDIFFTSLAAEARHKAIAIVLSGTNEDGSEGAKSISEHGGTVLVQEPKTADHERMPNNVIEYDSPEEILPPKYLIDAVLERTKGISPVKSK